METPYRPQIARLQRANFAAGSRTIKDMELIRKKILRRLRHDFPQGRKITQIGSFYDGPKIGKLNEADCHLLMDHDDIAVVEGSKGGQFKIWK